MHVRSMYVVCRLLGLLKEQLGNFTVAVADVVGPQKGHGEGGCGAPWAGGSAACGRPGAAHYSPKLLLKDGTKGGSSSKPTGLPVTGEGEVGVLNTLRGLKGLGRHVTDRQPWARPVIGRPLTAERLLLGNHSPYRGEDRAQSHKRDTLPFSENKSPPLQLAGDSFRAVAMTTQSV